MNKLSSLLLVVIVFIGGAGIANYMYSNVHERRKEIGILMALGAMPLWIVKMFMLKAFIIGLIGGLIGYAVGTVMAVTLGPAMAGIPVFPMPWLIAYSMVISIVITLIGSLPPAYKATRIDPYVIMREE
jgi:putative ABC transport system permease protein